MTAPGQVRDQAGGRWPLSYPSVPVPFIAAWSTADVTDVASGHLVLRTEAFTRRWQVRYRDEQPTDRDRHDILWHRVAFTALRRVRIDLRQRNHGTYMSDIGAIGRLIVGLERNWVRLSLIC